MPSTVFDVIEDRTLAVTCRCGHAHVSNFPNDVTEMVQYGPNVRAPHDPSDLNIKAAL